MAEALRAYAREGIAHVQLVLDPITRAIDPARVALGAGGARPRLIARAWRTGTSVRAAACEPGASIRPPCEISNRLARRGRGRGPGRGHAVGRRGSSPSARSSRARRPRAAAATPTVADAAVPRRHLGRPVTRPRARDRDAVLPRSRPPGSSSPPTTPAGTGKGELVKRIDATYAGWPLIISQYSSAKALAKANSWVRAKPGPGRTAGGDQGHEHPHRVGSDDRRAPPKPDARQRTALAALIAALDGLLSPLQTRVERQGRAARATPLPAPAPSPTATDTGGAGGLIGVSPSPRETTGP